MTPNVFKVQILRAYLSSYWYSKHIGEIYDVVRHPSSNVDYKVVDITENGEIVKTPKNIDERDCMVLHQFRNEIDRILEI